MEIKKNIVLASFILLLLVGNASSADLLFSEGFENNSWADRDWYDGTTSTGTEAGGQEGNALKLTWAQSATRPTGFTTIRNTFTATDELFVEYYVNYETGWRGSGVAYHPHILHILSEFDAEYQGLSFTASSLYFEAVSDTTSPYLIRPAFAHQDSVRVNTGSGTPPNDLRATTENRSANHCNTPGSASGATGICYSLGGGNYYSANIWQAPSVTVPSGEWVRMRYYVKMNTFNLGVGQFDGILRVWVNDSLAVEQTSVLYASGDYASTLWDKIIIAPWIGDGSPISQSMWLDELKVYDGIPSSSISAPSGLRVVGGFTWR